MARVTISVRGHVGGLRIASQTLCRRSSPSAAMGTTLASEGDAFASTELSRAGRSRAMRVGKGADDGDDTGIDHSRPHVARMQAEAGDGVHPGESGSGPDARAARNGCSHEPLSLRAPLPAHHGAAAPPVRGASEGRPRRDAAGHSGAVHRAHLAGRGLPHAEPLLHGVPPDLGRHPEGVSRRVPSRRPLTSGGRARWK
jgi:hypothetical protein